MLISILYYLVVLLLSLTVLITLYYYHAFSYWKSRGMPHLSPTFPFGNGTSKVTKLTGNIVADIYRKLKERGEQYGGFYFFTSPTFMPISPEVIKMVLMQNYKQFEDHGIYIDLERDRMAANLLTFRGQAWKQIRTKMTPAFSPGRIKMMLPILMECCQDFDEILTEVARKGESVDSYEFVSRYFTDVISDCAFGIKCNTVRNPDSEFRKYGKLAMGQSLLNLIRLRLVTMLPSICRIFKINMFPPEATDFFLKVIQDTIAHRMKNNIQRADLLDNLIQHRKKHENDKDGFDDIQIAAHAFVFYLGGFETSATNAACALCELADNQDIQNKVRNEILHVLKEDKGELTYEGFAKMKYLDKVISESLRKYPSINIVNRMCTGDFTIPGTNITVKKGTRTLISILGIHNDPEYYPDPDKFDPERFNEENVSKRIPFTYLPFGEGPRICPGYRFGVLQIKFFLVYMLKNFRYTLHPSVKLPIKIYNAGNLAHPFDKLLVNIERI